MVPFAEYCQAPSAAVAALPTTATPARVLALDPPGTWSAASPKLAANSAAAVAPSGLLVSSGTAGRVAAPVATGASLTAVTITLTVAGAVPPLPSEMV